MPAERAATPLFACGGYDIGDERLASHREITIRSGDSPPPSTGDAFTIARGETIHDLVVLSVLRRGPDWTARCGVVGRP